MTIKPKVPALDIYFRVMRTNRHTRMFIKVRSLTAPGWKQTKCPSTEEQDKDTVHIHVLEYYSAIKRTVLLTTHSNVDELQKQYVERSQAQRLQAA